MKFGVKTFFDAEFADYFKDKADFLEVMAVVGEDYSFLDGYLLPIVVHAMHSGFGINLADEGLYEKNREAVDFAIEVANRCGAKKIIVHAGRLSNENCSVEMAVDFLEGLDDRIIVENLTDRECGGICSRPKEMRDFVSRTGRGFCFDVNHAMEVAVAEDGVDYFDYIRKFVEMGPVHCHLGGCVPGDKGREHLSFVEAEFSVGDVLGMLPKDAWVTIETTNDVEGVESDLGFLRSCVK